MGIKKSYFLKKTDEELMKFVVDRNTNAFRVLYQRYEVAIYNFLLGYTGNIGLAQDLLQETFTRIWFASHSFNYEKGKFKTWLFTIALNITRSEMTKKQYSYSYRDITEMNSTEAGLIQPKQEQPDKRVENLELQKSIQEALSNLQPFLREIIILKHYQQLKFKEIAQITNTPEGTLKSRFHRAILLLKEHLSNTGNNYAAS